MIISASCLAGRFPVTEAEEGTRDWPAYSVDCPPPAEGGCGEPAGFRCIYTTGPDSEVSAYGRPRDYLHPGKFHLKGDMTVRPHHVRSNRAVALAAARAARARRKAALPPVSAVNDKEAYEVKCPACGREPKRKCIRMSTVKRRVPGSGYDVPVIVHRKGTNISKPHPRRRAEAARLRLIRWKRENPVQAHADDLSAARAALAAFDRAEFEQLRAWLAEHGAILWGGTRPDGTLRGGTYALG